MYKEWRSISGSGNSRKGSECVNILVCGISKQSVDLCNLLNTGFQDARVVGILADENSQVKREIHGFEVLGQTSDLAVLHALHNIHQVWISSSFNATYYNNVEKWCIANNVELVVLEQLPGFRSLLTSPGKGLSFSPRKSAVKASVESESAA